MGDRGDPRWWRTWDSKRRLYGCQVSQGQVSHKTLGTLHLACHESLLLESHARSSISFMVGPLDGRVVRPWGTSSRHLVGAPPWGTRVPEGDCWHGGQGFSLSGFLGHLVTPLPASHIRPPKVEIDWQASGNPEGKPLTHRQLTLQPRLCLENSLGTQFLVSPSRPGLAWKQNRSTGREFSCSSWRCVPGVPSSHLPHGS